MAHRYGALTNASSGVYYPDRDETGKIADEVTFMGDTAGNADFPTDGSKHTIIYKILILAATGTFGIVNTSNSATVVNIVATSNSPQVLDFGSEGLRVAGGFKVVVPTGCVFNIIYDMVST